MEKVVSHKIAARPTINIYSEPSELTLSLVEKFLSSYFCVNIFAENLSDWGNLLFSLKDNTFLKLFSLEKSDIATTPSYVIFVSLSLSKLPELKIDDIIKKENSRTKEISTLFKKYDVKKIFILPLVNEGVFRSLAKIYNVFFSSVSPAALIVYADEVFGPRMLLTDRRLISSAILHGQLEKGNHPTSFRDFYFPTNVDEFARHAVKIILSGNYYGTRIRITSSKTPRVFLEKILQNLLSKNLVFNNIDCELLIGEHDKEINLPAVSESSLIKTVEWFKNNNASFREKEIGFGGLNINVFKQSKQKKQELGISSQRQFVGAASGLGIISKTYKGFLYKLPLKKSLLEMAFKNKGKIISKRLLFRKASNLKLEKITGKLPYSRTLSLVAAFFFAVLITPFLLLITSFFPTYVGYRNLRTANFKRADSAFKIAKVFSSLSVSQFRLYSDIPVLGDFYSYVYKASDVLLRTQRVGEIAGNLLSTSSDFFSAFIKGGDVDVAKYSQESLLYLDSLYREVSFAESEIYDLGDIGIPAVSRIIKNANLDHVRKEVEQAKDIASELPVILGQNEEKKYLVLFQNNMELRPSGGFIGSFAIVTLRNGGMKNVEVFDVYSADGQLKGHVEPPWQINKYMSQATWYLRDSNWDPDFEVSAARAEWFLDKEMDILVDGTISLDLNPIKNLVEIFGELDIGEFNQKLNANNFYETVQYQAEKEFFPGSRNKANFLSAVATTLVDRVKDVERGKYLSFFRLLYTSLSEKHIQIFLHDTKAQKVVSNLNWSGVVNTHSCLKENCVSDWFGVVEANLGVNKSNYFVSRRMELATDLTQKTVVQDLNIYLINSANTALGDSGTYKTYLRVVVPKGANLRSAFVGDKSVIGDLVEDSLKDRGEFGLWIVVSPQEEKKISLSWESLDVPQFSKNGEYRLNIRKQSGIDNFPVDASLILPSGVSVGTNIDRVLTLPGGIGYNTKLAQDFSARIFW